MAVRYVCFASAFLAIAAVVTGRGLIAQSRASVPEIRLMTLDPGHFHASLVQKAMYAGVSPRVHVFAPLGPDLIAHLNRISAYNTRAENPTAWADRGAREQRLLRAHAPDASRQRRHHLGPEPRKDRPNPPVGAVRAQRARGQAVDSRRRRICHRSTPPWRWPTPGASPLTTS